MVAPAWRKASVADTPTAAENSPRRGVIAVSFSSGFLVGAIVTLAILLAVLLVLKYSFDRYFPEGYEIYADKFMDLEEVQALYREYPMAGPHVNINGRLAYNAAPDDGSGIVELEIWHKRHSFEVTGMTLTCWGRESGPPAWYADEDVLHYIDNRRCF